MRHHLMDHVDLLQYRLHGGRTGWDGRNIDRPELSADAPEPQARDVRDHQRRKFAGVVRQVDGAEIIAALAILLRQVVVAVDERNFAQELANFRQGGGVWYRYACRLGSECAGCDHRKDDSSYLGAGAHADTRLRLDDLTVKPQHTIGRAT
jgi:hypothetical protein